MTGWAPMDGFSEIPKEERRAIRRRAFVDTLPILMGYTTMGFAAGVLMAVKGGVALAPVWAGLCGFLFVSGTLSFAIVPAFAGDMSLGALAVMALGMQFRYAFYGFSVVGRWRGVPLPLKWFLVHSLADEVFALDVACDIRDPLRSRYYSFWNHLLDVAYWVAGTTAGGVAGAALPIPSKGIEFAMVALFLVILTDQMRGIVSRRVGGLRFRFLKSQVERLR